MTLPPTATLLSFRSTDAWDSLHANRYVIQLSCKRGKVPFATIAWTGGPSVSPEVRLLTAVAWGLLGRDVIHDVGFDDVRCTVTLYAVDNGKLYRDEAEAVIEAFVAILIEERDKLLGPAPDSGAGLTDPASDGAEQVRERGGVSGSYPGYAVPRDPNPGQDPHHDLQEWGETLADYRVWDIPLLDYR